MTLLHVSSAVAIAITGFWATMALWLIGKARLEGIARNPEAWEKMNTPAILALAFTEAIAIYGFVIAFMILNK